MGRSRNFPPPYYRSKLLGRCIGYREYRSYAHAARDFARTAWKGGEHGQAVLLFVEAGRLAEYGALWEFARDVFREVQPLLTSDVLRSHVEVRLRSLDGRLSHKDAIRRKTMAKKASKAKTDRPKVEFNMLKSDGNAFSLLAAFGRAAAKAGWTEAQIAEVRDKATDGDYDQLVATLLSYCK